MGVSYPGIHKPIVAQILKYFTVDTFVETGTFEGSTAYWASQYFRRVFTIESSVLLWESAKKKYRKTRNITFLFGDSRDILVKLSSEINSSTVFWLDAHWSGGDTYGENDECALLGELEAILAMPQSHFILVDDARLFMAPPPRPHSPNFWPDIAEVLAVVGKTSRYYTVILDDVIVISPIEAKPLMMAFYQDYVTEQWKKIDD